MCSGLGHVGQRCLLCILVIVYHATQHYQDSLNDVPTLNYRKVLFLKGRDVVPIYRASHMNVACM